MTTDPRPFRIYVSDDVLDDLRRRLAATRWPDALPGSGWTYGMDLDLARRLVARWADGFDWRGEEARLNRLEQYRVGLGGLGVHFVHRRAADDRALPLLLLHGWPGGFPEFEAVLPPLADPVAAGADAADAFHVVVPSMPGYGFSDRPTGPGMTNRAIAGMWVDLMERLGYRRFGVQGGDWGAGVGTWMARLHPERVVGLHLNYIPGSYAPWRGRGSPPLTPGERRFTRDVRVWMEREGAYGHLQATRPQTLAFALHDSPAGLAAWIVEKFFLWGDCGGELESRFRLDDLLALVTLYWVTGTAHSSCRLYFESRRTPLRFRSGERVRVPTGIARFPAEAPFPPREWVERAYDVARWTEMPAGGHFAAMEEPGRFVEDVREFFRPLR